MPYDCSGNYTDATGTYSSTYCCDTTSGVPPTLDSTSVINDNLALLCKVRNGITALVDSSVSEYQIGSRRFKKQNLADLLALEKHLESKIYGGIAINYVVIDYCGDY